MGDQRQAWVARIAELLTRHWLGADVLTRAEERHAGLLDLVLSVLGRSGARPEGVRRSELADVLAEAAEQVRASGAALPSDPSEVETERLLAELDEPAPSTEAGWEAPQPGQAEDEPDEESEPPAVVAVDPVRAAVVAELGGEAMPALALAVVRVRHVLRVLEQGDVAVDGGGRPTAGGVRVLADRLRRAGLSRPPDDVLAEVAAVAMRVRDRVAA